MNNQPTLPSAKPAKALLLTISSLSLSMLVAGIGLGFNAVAIYQYRADQRLDKRDAIAQLEDRAEVSQRRAQLKRGISAPVWIGDSSYSPDVQYQVSGVRKVEVPVVVGFEFDTAVCVGTIGPDGFIQNPDHPLCLGY